MRRFHPFPHFVLPLLAALAAPAWSAGDAFLIELDDLPLPPGLTETPGGLLFDSADGRIVEAKASGALPADKVRHYYEQTLAQLGWQMIGPLKFSRDSEILTILLDDAHGPLLVHFSLTPTH